MRYSCPFSRFLASVALALAALIPLPAAAQSIEYEFDPAFNDDFWIDAFTSGETTGASRYGSKIVRLPGGDVVIAGLVRLDNDPVVPNWNIGLLRMSPSGTRQVWTGSGPHFHAGKQYVVYPNLAAGGGGLATIRKLADFAYARGRFYVLVRSRFSEVPLDQDVQMLVFNEDGSYLNAINVLNGSADENAFALDVRETGSLANPVAIAVLGTVSGIRGAVAKFLVNSSGNIQLDASFGGGDGRVEFVMPPNECSYADCEFGVADIAFPQGGGSGSNLPVYVAGSVRRQSPSSTDFDMVIFKFAPDGSFDANFDTNGIRQYWFDLPNSTFADFARALIVRRSLVGNLDTVWLLGAAAGRCSQLAGVFRLDGGSGVATSTFGPGGRVTFGSAQSSPGDPCPDPVNLDPSALIAIDDNLFVGGGASIADPNFGSVSVLATLTSETGTLLSLDGFLLANVSPSLSRIDGLVAGEGERRVYAAGSGAVGPYNSLFLAARFKPGDDTIFAYGFQDQSFNSH